MRVAIVTHNVIPGDGQGRVNLEIARCALEHEHEVTIVADQVCTEVLDLGARWLRVHPMKGSTLVKVMDFAWRADKVIRQIRDDMDIICTNGVVCFEPHDVNIVHFVHSSWLSSSFHPLHDQWSPRTLYQYVFTRVNATLERRVFSRCRKIVGVSDLVTSELERIGVPQARVDTIPNGVSLSEFYPGKADRSRWGLPDGANIALFAGDINSNRKNLGSIMLALKELPTWYLVVAGTVGKSPYPEMSRKLGIQDRTNFLGFRDDLPELMRAVDTFVFPSRYEPFGLVILEALASGTPVITASSVGASQVLTAESNCGIVLEDSEDILSLIQAFKDVETMSASVELSARNTAEAYSWNQMGIKYLYLFEDLKNQSDQDRTICMPQ